MSRREDLIAYLFEGQAHLLSSEMAQWLASSARFSVFVQTYRDKIRKKLRVTREPESILDMRSELEVAYGLLSSALLSVTYEPYASTKQRGPDFGITYRGSRVFNIEVARLRVEENENTSGDDTVLKRKEERIQRILLDKLNQMQAGMPNLLVIHTRPELARSIRLDLIMQAVKLRAERKDPAFYVDSRYSGPAGFVKDFIRLSGIILWAPVPVVAADSPANLWVNKQAHPELESRILRLISAIPEKVILTS